MPLNRSRPLNQARVCPDVVLVLGSTAVILIIAVTFAILGCSNNAVIGAPSTDDAKTYYVSNAGSDSNSGLDASHTWAHCPGMHGWTGSVTLNPGDTVLFNKGDTWSWSSVGDPFLSIPSSGTVGNPITFSSYGTGAQPVINGNGGQFGDGIVYINGQSYITLDGLELYNSGKCVLGVGPPSTGVIIQNCTIHHNVDSTFMLVNVDSAGTHGGITSFTFKNNTVYDSAHNGINIRNGVTYSTVSGNTIYNIQHDSIDTLNTGASYDDYITINNNDLYDTKCALYLVIGQHFTVYSNLIHDDMQGTANDGTLDSTGIKANEGSYNTFMNNVFWNILSPTSSSYAFWDDTSTNDNWWNNTVYNCYGTFLDSGNTNLNNQNNLAYACMYDAPSLRNYGSDPKFVNPTGTPPNLQLQASSPCVGQGANLSAYFTTDFLGATRPATGPWDLGAY